jgi:hypothetical protein
MHFWLNFDLSTIQSTWLCKSIHGENIILQMNKGLIDVGCQASDKKQKDK